MTRRTKIFLVTSLVALTALLLVIVAELVLEHLGAGDPIVYYTNNTYRYAPLPNQRKHRMHGAWTTIDDMGLRTPEPWKDSADVRVLFIGNSITWSGTSIDDRATFPYLTCVELEKRTGLAATCGNAGVSAYGTDNMTARLRFREFHNEQAIVVTLIYPDLVRGLTELQRNYFFSSSPTGPLPAIWEVGTILLYRLTHWLRHHALIHYGEDGRGEQFSAAMGDQVVAEESLRRLLTVLRGEERKGKVVLLVLSPLFQELGGKESSFTVMARRVITEYKLPLIDMNEPVTQNYVEGFFSDDRHLGVGAHRLYAALIAEALLSRFDQIRR